MAGWLYGSIMVFIVKDCVDVSLLSFSLFQSVWYQWCWVFNKRGNSTLAERLYGEGQLTWTWPLCVGFDLSYLLSCCLLLSLFLFLKFSWFLFDRSLSLTKRLEHWPCNSEAPSSCPILTGNWICSL